MIRPEGLGRPTGTALAAAVMIVMTWLLAPAPAFAHRDPTIAVRLADVRPRLHEGVQLEVLDAERSYLALTNATNEPVYALDPDGRPFLRVSNDGVVGNVNSPYLASTNAGSIPAKPAEVDCCPGDRWTRLSNTNVWSWADPRLDPPQLRTGVDPNAGPGGRDPAGVLGNWQLGLQHNDRTVTARGVLERRRLGLVRTTIDSVPDGIGISVIESRPPQLRMVVPREAVVEVSDRDDRPFIRVAADGAFARTDSPDYTAHRRSIGLTPKSDAPWVPMDSGGPSKVSWADARIDFGGQMPKSLEAQGGVLGHWSIPVTVDGHRTKIRGTSWLEPAPVPTEPQANTDVLSGGSAPYVVAGSLTAVLVLAYAIARLRTKRTGV